MQNIAEFWNVATRPESNNGLGYSIEEARDEVARLEEFFEILHESVTSYAAWKELVIDNRVSGVKVHDARLVALMKVHGIRQIMTLNAGDFVRYAGIDVIHPDTVA